MKRLAILLLILITLGSASSALAMASTHYRLDWFTPLDSGGGGSLSSASYAADVTIGQTAAGGMASTNYGTGLGFWYGMLEWYTVYLPLAVRNYP